MDFDIISWMGQAEVIAAGRKIRDLRRLIRTYGRGRWRKVKRQAVVRFKDSGLVRQEEVHWYEAHGIGKREFKIKHRG